MYKCSECSSETIKWAGQCPNCKEWNTMIEQEEIKDDKRN